MNSSPLPYRVLSPIVSKGFRNDWQIRICQLSKCLVDFRGQPFDFWGGYGWFQKKISCRLISRGKKLARKYVGKIISHTEKKNCSWRIMLKKHLTSLYVGEKISNSRGLGKKYLPKLNNPYPPPPQKSNGQPLRRWGKKRIWHLSKCHPSTKWLTSVHHVVVFKTKVLHFKIENTPIKDTNGKRKFKRMLSFFLVDKRKLFAMKLPFEEFNLV